MRLTIVQYGGDYREAWERFDQGGKATYQAQRYSVDFVGSLAKRYDQVAVICATTEAAYDEVLPNKVRAIGAGLRSGFNPRELISLLERTSPDRLTLVTPMVPLLKWAAKKQVRTLATLADSFEKAGLRNAVRNWRLANQLNKENVEWVGNHGIAACLSLARIGVQQRKIIPWDWPPSHNPADYLPRELDPDGAFRIAYVGSVTERKGVGDLLEAVELLGRNGSPLELTIVGQDATGDMQQLASRLGLNDRVRFVGIVPNDDIPEIMRSADAVVVPSRHDYPEGLPLTIYEALATRTPIVASDHPMFRGTLVDGLNAVIFKAGDPEGLADSLERLRGNPDQYTALSRNSEQAWRALRLPVTWGDLIDNWLSDSNSSRAWLTSHQLSSGRYARQIAARQTVP